MEDRPNSEYQETSQRLRLHLSPEVRSDFDLGDVIAETQLVDAAEAQLAFFKKNSRLWVQFPDGEICDYPYYKKNIRLLIANELLRTPARITTDIFSSFQKTSEAIEKKLFLNASDVKTQWNDIIRAINKISSQSHSVKDLVDRVLELPFLRNFETSLIILHLKGQTRAELLGSFWRGQRAQGLVDVRDFNAFFTSIKKSKIKSFSTDLFPKINLPFNGSFLAKEMTSKKYSLVAVASRNDFLPYEPSELDLFETSIDLLQPHFERLIDQEFSDQRISELRVCLKEFPVPLRVQDGQTGTAFVNDLYRPELQDQDIFFNKKIRPPFSLDLYDSDELRHYAFDLFHFQRVSLLGELLNTLRHELSNPLFGLKLSSQIFATLDVAEDSKEIMKEVEKNINRSQAIIENFSSLYQAHPPDSLVGLKKLIEESIVLSKSETREIHKKISFAPETEGLMLKVPMIFVIQILFNLVVNAAQSMRQGEGRPTLELEITRSENDVFIDVQDSGPGVPTDKLGSLFKPFFTTKPQGTGLGLVLSRNLALKMGGNLEYIAVPDRQGARFRLTLPLP